MDDYLAKPIDPSRLDTALTRWLPASRFGRGAANGLAGSDPAPPEAGSESTLLDAEIIGRLRADFALELRHQLVATFEEQLDARLPDLDAALRCGDMPELRRLLHLLKGSAAMIGARALAAACAERRTEGSEGGPTLDPGLAGMRSLAQQTVAALRAELLGAEPSVAIY
jgi:HPt (histidine-containing phosphotransfer) domain-containing protein